MSLNEEIKRGCPMLTDGGMRDFCTKVYDLLVDLKARQAENKALLDELKTWASALATKLNADTGVADTDYDTTSAATPSDPDS